MKVDELIKIEGFQKKSAEKVVNEIREAVSRADCLTFMDASNLFGRAIGEKKLITFFVISSAALIVVSPCTGLSERNAPL